MSDDADRADSAVESLIQQGIARARGNGVLVAKGRCWYCDEGVDAVRLFCDPQCRDDRQAEEDAMKRAGR